MTAFNKPLSGSHVTYGRFHPLSRHRGVDYGVLDMYAAERRAYAVLGISREGVYYRGEWNTFSPRPVRLASCLKR